MVPSRACPIISSRFDLLCYSLTINQWGRKEISLGGGRNVTY